MKTVKNYFFRGGFVQELPIRKQEAKSSGSNLTCKCELQ